ncbi:hypothetical protein BDP27DRAFT_1441464 [Rhodocollybia butyracea]|uniref:C2H2-type domain-containing protein n=1 Tax=Rhodocollybia butyracea TaxID=206335 RepID=A0A9P5UGB0_9AGAR|nr:hypothetical protein BDP27DRAFT_1441464 [Rhodocollybia butyracea]
MSTAATLTTSSVIELARKTMLEQGLRCPISVPEQPPCTTVLACWETYRLHILREHCTVLYTRKNGQASYVHKSLPHCSRVSTLDSALYIFLQTSSGKAVTRKEYRCPFRCANHIQPSRHSLEQHLMLVHMSSIPLPCPFKACQIITPLESNELLVNHLQSVHNECIGLELGHLDKEGQLLPSWGLGSYIHIEDPPSLPDVVTHLDLIGPAPSYSEPLTPPPPSTPRLLEQPSPYSPHLVEIAALQSPQKIRNSNRLRLITMPKDEDSKKTEEEEKVEKEEISFEDLPVREGFPGKKDTKWHPERSELQDDWIIWKRPWRKIVSTPFHLQNPEEFGHIPPSSMDYEVFSARVDQLRADGILGK